VDSAPEHRLRREYRLELRAQISRTLSSPDDIDEEFLHFRKVPAAPA
jgi:hypothetical protein